MKVVLVVDDVEALAEQYAYDLARVGGYRTRQAASGPDALHILQTEPVDCVVLDLEMPGMDGFDVLRSLAEHAIRVPVIVYTGTGSYDRCVQAVRLGAYGFVDKAESMDRVVQEIENALRRYELETEVEGAASPARHGYSPHRRERGHARVGQRHRACCTGPEPCADPRREWDRQGARGP